MLNLNRTWVQKQGDFFVESPIILFAAIIWFLKLYKGGKYCTFPHAVEFLNRKYEDIFPILSSYPELENYMSPFIDAWQGGAADQLQGQIASAKIPLSRMISPQLYWVMSASEFTLDINNPNEPKILCVGNNPDRQNIYGAALGLYNSRIVKLINKKGMLKSSVIIDELPTIYFKGLDNLIATARSNKVAVCLGFQDFSQLVRDYGDKEAKVVQNTVGNIFSGQVVGETAKTLSERFGKVLQKRQSMTINRQDTSTSINTQMDSLIPPSKISTLTQGMFVGAVSDNFDERIDQKIFHAEIVVDNAKVAKETKAYKPIPIITDFTDEDGNDIMDEMVKENYINIKNDVKQFAGVLGVYDIILNYYGPNAIIGSLHVSVPESMTANRIHGLTRSITKLLYDKYHVIVTVGIYAVCDHGKESELQKGVMAFLKSYPHIEQVHGYSPNEKSRAGSRAGSSRSAPPNSSRRRESTSVFMKSPSMTCTSASGA